MPQRFRLIILAIIALAGSLFDPWESESVGFAKIYSPSGGFALGESGRATADGGFVVTGAHFDPVALVYNLFVLRLGLGGEILWQRVFAVPGGVVGVDVDATQDGGFVILGGVFSTRAGLIIRLDADGDLVWQKSISAARPVFFDSIEETRDGGYILGGSECVEVAPNVVSCQDGLVLKLSTNGAIEWQQMMVGGEFLRVRRRPDGGYVAAGPAFDTGSVNVFKFGATGLLEQAKAYKASSGLLSADDVQATSDGGIIFAGSSVVKLDSSGAIQWARSFQDFSSVGRNSIRQTSDGGYVMAIAPFSEDPPNTAGIAKLDSAGNAVWARKFARGQTSSKAVAETVDGSYVAFGGADTNNFAFVLKVDTQGQIPECTLLVDLSNSSVVPAIEEVSPAVVTTGNLVIQNANVSVTPVVFQAQVLCGSASAVSLSVTPAALNFDQVTVGSSSDPKDFMVQNTGGGTLSGTASASAPFSIVAGSSFNLGAGQSQAISVQFTPTSATTFASDVTIVSNGGSASPGVQGQGVTPALPPSVSFGAPSAANPQGMIAEPVNTATGNYLFQRTDLAIPGRGLPLILTRTYNSLDTYSGPIGPGWTHSYNILLTEAVDGSVTIKHGDGRTEFYDPQGGGVFKPRFAGVFSVLVKNANGTFTLTLKNQTKYQFSTAGKLTTITDRNGNAVSFAYDGAGNLITITDTVGRTMTLTYDASNRITRLTDPIARTVRYTYDAGGHLASVTNPLGGVVTSAYDASHRVTEIRDERGNQLLLNTYDGSNRVATQMNGRGFTTAFAYATPAAGQTTITDPRGNAIIHTHDSLFRLTDVKDANANHVTFTYDTDNNRTGITNQNAHTTSLAYDSRGNATSITDTLAHVITFTYDTQNNLKTATNARGFTTIFGYDAPGNLTSIQDATGNTTAFTDDVFGQLTRKTDARGNQTQYGYDGQGNLTRITDALGGVTTLAYDGIGRLLTLADPNGHVATAGYDTNSRLTQIVDPLGNTTRFTFDPVGNLIQILDAKGKQTGYAYDEVSNLASVIDALAHATRYTYDANNNRTAVTDANSHVTTYAFDALNRLSQVSDPLGHTTAYTYDPVGNVATVKDANGVTNVFSYDPNNRLTGIAYGDGASVAYSYDPNGKRLTMLDQRGTTGYGYDALDRLIQTTNPDSMAVSYGYDAVGNRASLTYPDGGVVTYGYDSLNRLSQLTDRDTKVTAYTYDAASNLIRTDYPNGTATTYQYDVANRLTAIQHMRGKQLLTSVAYTLDRLGNRLTKTKDGKLTSYSYDALSQLLSAVTKNQAQTNYTYDAVGNRVASASDGQVTQYIYDAADRLLQAGKSTFAYDANGNRTSMTAGVVTAYTYDAANRLTQVLKGTSASSAYEYDGDGNKVTQTLNGAAFHVTNDVATVLPVILAEQGPSSDISYVYGLGLISQSGSGFKDFYHTDGLGSIVLLTDTSGRQTAVYDYDAWGAPVGSGNASALGNPFRFTGEEVDDLTGFYYLRARWYDPAVARFVTKDPFSGSSAYPASLNRYAYAFNNPGNFLDRTGLEPTTAGALVSRLLKGTGIYVTEELVHDLAGGAIGSGITGRAAAYVGPVIGIVVGPYVTNIVAHPERDVVESWARFAVDATANTAITYIALAVGGPIGCASCTFLIGAELGAAYDSNRNAIQQAMLYNPLTERAGDFLFRNLSESRGGVSGWVGGWLGIK